MGEQTTYAAKDVYERLNVSDSTLRKWCLLLEEKGYAFTRQANNKRVYRESDVIMLERYKALVQDNGVHQEIAAHMILNPTDHNINSLLGESVTSVSVTERTENNAQLAVMELVNRTFTGLTVEMNKQTQIIDRQNELIEKLVDELKEVKLTIAAGQQKEEKGWIARWFKKR